MSPRNNMSDLDQLLRSILGLYAMLLGFLFIQGIVGGVIGVLGLVAFVTGLTGWCPLYQLLGKSTAAPEEEPGVEIQ